jgi:hypothetical protein
LATETIYRGKDTFNKANENVAAASLLMEAAVAMLREQGIIGREKADKILPLLSTEPETHT